MTNDLFRARLLCIVSLMKLSFLITCIQLIYYLITKLNIKKLN